VAVIDDEPAVHDGTRFALSDYRLNGQGLEILSAYSAAEGRELMRRHPDVAVVVLDVIMETDTAGLGLVEFIRKDLKNETVRIILRTGQPGQAPERRVIVDYDINDYKAKTELTADKLFTSLTAALRSYQQLQRMVETRRGLEMIIDGASTLYDVKSMQLLAEGVLTQIASLLNVDCGGILVLREGGGAQEKFSILAGSGCYRHFTGLAGPDTLERDLRNPLGVILGRAELMKELTAANPVPVEKLRDQLGHIRSSATQLTDMVNDLISDAMMDALDIAIRRERIDLAVMLGELVTSNRALAEKKNQTIHLVSPPRRMLDCDPDRLREAVDNLMSNAIKYSPLGGNIEISMGADSEDTVISVKDEGAGFSQADKSRLFGRFQRLSTKPTGGESSAGLGLSIVKRIVELHGGHVSAESDGPGRGATFTIRLPTEAAAS